MCIIALRVWCMQVWSWMCVWTAGGAWTTGLSTSPPVHTITQHTPANEYNLLSYYGLVSMLRCAHNSMHVNKSTLYVCSHALTLIYIWYVCACVCILVSETSDGCIVCVMARKSTMCL